MLRSSLLVAAAFGAWSPEPLREESAGDRTPFPLPPDSIVQQALLKASPGGGDAFGRQVAVSGNTVVVGAPFEDSNAVGVGGDPTNNAASNSGAAYVFVLENGVWSQQAYLKASNTEALDEFGCSVAISGDTLVVGARGEDSAAFGVNGDQSNNDTPDSGAAYVFVRSGTSWSQQAYLKSFLTRPGDHFGNAVAIAGDTLVVGAEAADAGAIDSGAAYVFTRSAGTWSQPIPLHASNAGFDDRFGISVAIAEDVLAVGAWLEDSNATGVNGDQTNGGAGNSGAAYVFRRNGAAWDQEAYLKASNTDPSDHFGWSVALSGDSLVVSAPSEDSQATGVNGDPFGNDSDDSGAAYVFVHAAGAWSQQAYLKPSHTQLSIGSANTSDNFGYSVSISGETIGIGAPQEDSNAKGINGDPTNESASDSGAGYVFERSGSTWSLTAYVKASNSSSNDRFGTSVSLSEETVVFGAENEDSGGVSGAAYVLGFGFLPAVLFRNAGTNPASYAADLAVVGGSFTASVDNTLAAQLTSRLIAFEAPTALALGGGQTLLCLDLGAGELFAGSSLAPSSSSAGVDGYSLLLPNDPALSGFTFASQAIQFGNPPFVLSNAQDLTIGGF